MRETSEIWKQITSNKDFSVQSKVTIDGIEYLSITAPVIDRQTMPTALSIGNCCNASLSFSILIDDESVIQKGAEVVVLARVYDNNSASEWKEFGTFYIVDRDSEYQGLVNITAYDSMFKADEELLKQESLLALNWPQSQKNVVNLIAQRLGVQIDTRTKINEGGDYIVSLPTGLSMRQLLCYIALCNGGNWIITEDNKLYLVPLIRVPVEDNDTYRVVSSAGENIKTQTNDFLAWYKKPSNAVNVPVVMNKLSSGNVVTITGVIASRTLEIATSVESDDIATDTEIEDVTSHFTASNSNNNGVTLDAGDSPYMTQRICNDLYNKYKDFTYHPYIAEKIIYDPAAEIGDIIKIGNKVHSVLYNTKITLDIGFTADAVLPVLEEASSDYQFKTENAKLAEKIDNLHTAIENTRNSLKLSVKNIGQQIEDDREHYDAELELKVDTESLISEINATADVINLRGGHFTVSATNISIDRNGNVSIKGVINATGGNFTGTINSATINSSNIIGGSINISNNFLVNSSGTMSFAGNLRMKPSGYSNFIDIIAKSTKENYPIKIGASEWVWFDNQTYFACSVAKEAYFGSNGEIGYGMRAFREDKEYVSGAGRRYIFRPESNNGAYLGTSSYRWHSVYCGDGAFNGSDRKIKNHIDYLSNLDELEAFIMALKPVMYTLKNGESKRRHLGFYAQDVAEAAKNTIGDIAAYQATVIEYDDEGRPVEKYFDDSVDDDNLLWCLNYNELDAPNIAMLQKLILKDKENTRIIQQQQEQIDSLNNAVTELQAQMQEILSKIDS